MFVDVHCHLTHDKFKNDLNHVINACQQAELGSVVVNGLDPLSNRAVLELSTSYPLIKAALGIYPVYAVQAQSSDLPSHLTPFNVEDELQFIESAAQAQKIIAFGECGLDGHWVGSETFPVQEKVFERFIELNLKYDIPLIIHSRKLETRALEIVRHYQVKRAVFHCFSGKPALAIRAAHEEGYAFSIPTHAARSESFKKMIRDLPATSILTETDAPYLAPIPQDRNDPTNVRITIKTIAKCRNISDEEAQKLVWSNYERIFKATH